MHVARMMTHVMRSTSDPGAMTNEEKRDSLDSRVLMRRKNNPREKPQYKFIFREKNTGIKRCQKMKLDAWRKPTLQCVPLETKIEPDVGLR